MSDELILGDKVRLKATVDWTQPWQKFAQERRLGEVRRVFTPLRDRSPTYCVVFPVKQKGATPRQIFLTRADLVLEARTMEPSA